MLPRVIMPSSIDNITGRTSYFCNTCQEAFLDTEPAHVLKIYQIVQNKSHHAVIKCKPTHSLPSRSQTGKQEENKLKPIFLPTTSS